MYEVPATLNGKLEMARRLLDAAEHTLLRAGQEDHNEAMRNFAHQIALSNLQQLVEIVHRAEMDLALSLINAPFIKSEDMLHGHSPAATHPNTGIHRA